MLKFFVQGVLEKPEIQFKTISFKKKPEQSLYHILILGSNNAHQYFFLSIPCDDEDISKVTFDEFATLFLKGAREELVRVPEFNNDSEEYVHRSIPLPEPTGFSTDLKKYIVSTALELNKKLKAENKETINRPSEQFVLVQEANEIYEALQPSRFASTKNARSNDSISKMGV